MFRERGAADHKLCGRKTLYDVFLAISAGNQNRIEKYNDETLGTDAYFRLSCYDGSRIVQSCVYAPIGAAAGFPERVIIGRKRRT